MSPASYDALTQAMPEDPAMRVLSRSKNAADRAIRPPRLESALARDLENDRVALASA